MKEKFKKKTINNKDVSEGNDETVVEEKKSEASSDKKITNLEEVHSDPN